ncbi:DprA-like DNA processing chain A [Streptomyces phage LuckySocke]|jgi:hypothetical protein|nr:DprA-like DNA processing chain A [Streptomyces phage Alone3]WPH58898.1 DprA-like DNA processing chain A [Streptomyces phage LuckySocke]
MTVVVITGSRDWPPHKAPAIWEALEKLWFDLCVDVESWETPDVEFHHGECPYGGADLIGASWAHGAGWKVVPHRPLEQKGWAYAKRNQEMIDLKPDYVVACFLEGAGNRGTQMTYDMAVAAGLKDRIVEVRA